MKSLLRSIVFLFTCSFASLSYATVILLFDPVTSELLGANGVDVNGTLYDVEFRNGSCAGLYNGCDELSDLPFADDPLDAIRASSAIERSIFNLAPPEYTSDPGLTRGCEGDTSCTMATPFDLFQPDGVGVVLATNVFGAGNPWSDLTSFTFPRDGDTTGGNFLTYAVWTLHSVPEPGSLALFVGGMIASLVTIRRRASGAP